MTTLKAVLKQLLRIKKSLPKASDFTIDIGDENFSLNETILDLERAVLRAGDAASPSWKGVTYDPNIRAWVYGASSFDQIWQTLSYLSGRGVLVDDGDFAQLERVRKEASIVWVNLSAIRITATPLSIERTTVKLEMLSPENKTVWEGDAELGSGDHFVMDAPYLKMGARVG